MENQFVGYKESKQLSKLGFSEECFGGYLKKDKTIWIGYVSSQGGEQFNRYYHILAPTFSQAFKFFRDKYNLQHELCSLQKDSWLITIWDISSTTEHGVYNGKRWDCDDLDENIPHTYEEAEEVCLKKIIEIVKK